MPCFQQTLMNKAFATLPLGCLRAFPLPHLQPANTYAGAATCCNFTTTGYLFCGRPFYVCAFPLTAVPRCYALLHNTVLHARMRAFNMATSPVLPSGRGLVSYNHISGADGLLATRATPADLPAFAASSAVYYRGEHRYTCPHHLLHGWDARRLYGLYLAAFPVFVRCARTALTVRTGRRFMHGPSTPVRSSVLPFLLSLPVSARFSALYAACLPPRTGTRYGSYLRRTRQHRWTRACALRAPYPVTSVLVT